MKLCEICDWPIPVNSTIIDYCLVCGSTIADERELRRIAGEYAVKVWKPK